MIFIVFFWITSCLGGLWFLNVIGLIGLTVKAYPNSFTATANNLSSQPSQFCKQAKKTNSLEENSSKFCFNVPKIIPAQSGWENVITLVPMTLIESHLPNIDLYPDHILRSLQNFLGVHLQNPVPVVSPILAPAPSFMMVVNSDQQKYEVWVNHHFVAYIPDEMLANLLKQRLRQLGSFPQLDATQLRPALVDGTASLMIGNHFLFGIDKQISTQLKQNADLLAIEWINNLRIALKSPPLTLIQAQMSMYGLRYSEVKFSGVASWYGDDFDGRLTANGEIYHQNEFTVAHRSLPFNTYLQVTNLQNGQSVIVRVNDRGPYIPPRSLDLSMVAAQSIHSENTGVVPYEAVILQPTSQKMTVKQVTPKNEPMTNSQVIDFN